MIALLFTAAAQGACTRIVGALTYLESGPSVGAVLVVEERIAAVGAKVPETWRGQKCETVDGTNKQLTAGFVAVPTQIGLVEIGLEASTRDDDPQTPNDPVRAALYAADAYEPLSTLVRITRLDGITTALTLPSGGFVSGHAALVALDGATQAETLIDRDAALVLALPTASFAEALQQIRELVDDVSAYAARPSSFDTRRTWTAGASRLDLEALRPAIAGKIPILVDVDRASQLEALIRLQRELGLRFVVQGGAEGWLVADALAQARIPVIVDPLVYGPHSFDTIHARSDNAALLKAAGVSVIIAPPERANNVRSLRETAGNAVREGLDHDAAITALTRAPALAFGMNERGRIAVGAIADLVLWSGDPLELSSVAERVWIEGRAVELRSRQTELFEKYRTLPGTPAPALPLVP